MKYIAVILLFFCLSASAQTGLNVRLTDSQLKGLLGVEFQIEKFSVSAGWKPCRVSIAGDWVQCYSIATTYYLLKGTTPYLSIGATDKGIAKLNNTTNKFDIFPAYFIIPGIRTYPYDIFPEVTDRLSFDIGLGAKISQVSVRFALECCFNYRLFEL